MEETPKTQQIPFEMRRRHHFHFIFRIHPHFFIGFVPRMFERSYDCGGDDYYHHHNDDDMCIRRINEHEFMFLRRMGFHEMEVMM